MRKSTFIAHGNGSNPELTFQTESFFQPSITQMDRDMENDSPKPVVLIGTIAGGEVKIGDSITIEVGSRKITDTVCQLQKNKTNITHAIAGESIGMGLQNTTIKQLKSLLKQKKVAA